MKDIIYVPEDKTYVFECPHCNLMIQVSQQQVICKTFRHGVMKDTMKQIPPHTKKDECERLKNADLIYGCGKPFKMFKSHKKYAYVDVCDYI